MNTNPQPMEATMNRTRYFTSNTTATVLVICPKCSTSDEVEHELDPRSMREDGFELRDGAWYGLCPRCREAQVEASNAEYEALVRAAAQLTRAGHQASPLSFIEIPAGEGFRREGETRYGFWCVSGCYTDAGFERFRATAAAIVRRLNEDRGTGLVFNTNVQGTQAILHGVVD